MARLAAARGRRRSRRPADHVRRRRRAAAARARAAVAAGLRGLAPGARSATPPSRRSSSSTSTARCIDALLPGAACAASSRTTTPGALQRQLLDVPRGRLARARTRASGRCAARGGTSPTRRSWPGSRSTGRSRTVEQFGPRRARSSAGARSRDEIHAEVLRAAATTRARQRSRSPTAPTSSTRACCMMPLVGFLPPDDPRVIGTVEAIERELTRDGFVQRYQPTTDATSTACRRARASFLPCSLLAGRRATRCMGRHDEARALFERLLALRNDVGLLVGGVRPDRAPPARQLPAGVHPRRARQHGARSLGGTRAPATPETRR